MIARFVSGVASWSVAGVRSWEVFQIKFVCHTSAALHHNHTTWFSCSVDELGKQ